MASSDYDNRDKDEIIKMQAEQIAALSRRLKELVQENAELKERLREAERLLRGCMKHIVSEELAAYFRRSEVIGGGS